MAASNEDTEKSLNIVGISFDGGQNIINIPIDLDTETTTSLLQTSDTQNSENIILCEQFNSSNADIDTEENREFENLLLSWGFKKNFIDKLYGKFVI